MLSRTSTQSLLRCLRQFQVPAACTSTSTPQNAPPPPPPPKPAINPERIVRFESTPPTVFGFIPKSWFDFMYPKTGVTGPYMLGAGLMTYIVSKEILVFHSETVLALAYVFIMVSVHKLYGNQIKEYILKMQEENARELDSSQEMEKEDVRTEIANNEKALWQAEGVAQYLPEAKREGVYLQMEAAYRARLQEAYLKVKRHLDYQVEKQNVERRNAQRNMVDYVLRHVEKSITPQLKKNALKQCLGDLKALASKA